MPHGDSGRSPGALRRSLERLTAPLRGFGLVVLVVAMAGAPRSAAGWSPAGQIGEDRIGEEGAEMADRLVAVVDDDPILASDMERVIRLGLIQPREGESEGEFRERVLDEIIVIRLRIHEVDRFGAQELPLARVEAQYDEVRQRFDSQQEFEAALEDLGLTADELREILARQLLVLSFVEERLGPAVFVSLDDIGRYYDEVLVPEMRRQGEEPPERGKVREEIRAVLREQRLNEEIESWTDELRLRADISVYLDTDPGDLPPKIE